MPFLPRQSEAIAPSAWGQAMRDAELAQPKTSTVIGAFAEEATVGVGTGYADIQALKAQAAGGKKLNKEEMTPYEGVSWYGGITDEAARVQKEFNDSAQARAKIISEASTGQAIAGFMAGFGAGVFEPKNAAIGLGVTLAAGPLGTAGYLGNRARMMYQLAKTSTRARVGIGASEGLVAAALTEPSNRYSAKVLQQDYTMMDSAFNVLTSTAFGAAVPAVSGLIKAKVEKFKGRTMDVIAAEVDLATQQLELGQRVDVSAVEAAQAGKLADAPVARQVEAANVDLPQIQIDALAYPDADTFAQAALRGEFDLQKYRTKEQIAQAEAVSIAEPKLMSVIQQSQKLAREIGTNEPTKKQIKDIEKLSSKRADLEEILSQARTNPAKGFIEVTSNKDANLVALKDFYNETKAIVNNKVVEADAANTATIARHNTQATDPRNDTAIDYDAVDALDERRAIMEAESEAEAEMYFQQAEAEIRQMLDDGTLNEADLEDYRKILEDMNDSKKTTDALETLKLCLTGL